MARQTFALNVQGFFDGSVVTKGPKLNGDDSGNNMDDAVLSVNLAKITTFAQLRLVVEKLLSQANGQLK